MSNLNPGLNRILNCIPSRETENDWSADTALQAGLTTATAPKSKDLRDERWWPVSDQGTTGSCVGWAATDSVLLWHVVITGMLPKSEKLSVRFTWMASKETDEFRSRPETFIDEAGTSLKAALTILKDYGAVREKILPFQSGLAIIGENVFYALAAKFKIRSYFDHTQESDKLGSMRSWIANNGPILVRLKVDSTWENVGRDGMLSVYDPLRTRKGGHAAAIVGYTEDYFIIRNSWGDKWGDKGYAYASNQYTMDAFTEAYGITL